MLNRTNLTEEIVKFTLFFFLGDDEPVNDHSLAEVADGVCWEDLSYASLWIMSFGHLRKPIIVVIVVGNDTTFDYGMFPADPPSVHLLP